MPELAPSRGQGTGLSLCLVLATLGGAAGAGETPRSHTARGDIPFGDPQRGAAIVASRSAGLCVLCHAVPGMPATQVGDLGPDLAGVGARLSAEQLRQRLLAPERSNPDTVMPSYGRSDGLARVASSRQGQPLLDPRQIDDVLAYLGSLK